MDLILDTDIGDDIDDALALLLALKSPEFKVNAVTTVYGDVETRAMLALRIMEEMGLKDIPVKPGISKPLLEPKPTGKPNQAVILEGWERRILDGGRGEAVTDFIASRVKEAGGEAVIVSLGPLTNIALTLASNPWIADEARLIIMGGCYSSQVAEHNIRCDPEAAKIVFESGIPLTMVGLDVTVRCMMDRKHVEALKSSDLPEVRLVSRMMDVWMETVKPGHAPILHDPLAVAVVFKQSLVEVKPMRICVEVKGEHTRGFTVPVKGRPNANVCVNVDREAFMEVFIERILS